MVAPIPIDIRECEISRFRWPVGSKNHSIQSGAKATGTSSAIGMRGRALFASIATATCPAYNQRIRQKPHQPVIQIHGATMATPIAIHFRCT
jgi:hypothetical protein